MIIQVFSNSMTFPCMELSLVISRFSRISRACGNPVSYNTEDNTYHTITWPKIINDNLKGTSITHNFECFLLSGDFFHNKLVQTTLISKHI